MDSNFRELFQSTQRFKVLNRFKDTISLVSIFEIVEFGILFRSEQKYMFVLRFSTSVFFFFF